MLQMLGNPAVARLDSTLMVLLAAAVTEHHCGNVMLAYKHWTGVLGHVRGYLGGLRGVQRIGFAKGMALVEGILMQHVPLFESRARLSEAMSRLSVPRARFPLDSRLWKFFGSDVQGRSERDIAFHLANLHLVSMMLVGEWVGFMVELARLLLGGGEEITPTGVTFMICQSAVRTGEWYGEAPKLRMWETLEFVRLIMYAEAESRKSVVRAMSAPLLGFSPEDLDLEVLKREVEEGWEMRHDWSSGETTDGRQNASTVGETGEPPSAVGNAGKG
jgi:hypothetical protein